jgi:erythromycin esterase-like protein
MAEILLDIRAEQQRRGPTLVFAHNRHVQRQPSTWRLAGMDLIWPSAGRILSALLAERYAVVVGSLGASAALGLAAPPAGTFEAALTAGLHVGAHPGGETRTDTTPEQGYFPLDAETVAHGDAVWHIDAP